MAHSMPFTSSLHATSAKVRKNEPRSPVGSKNAMPRRIGSRPRQPTCSNARSATMNYCATSLPRSKTSNASTAIVSSRRPAFAANNTGWQTDHILPWSRFGDDSYLNKTLCCTRCNQHKKGRTPFEWFCEMTETEWDTFLARLENLKEMKGLKKRNFKLRDAAWVEDKFKKRNLTDTRWVTRLLANELNRMFPAPEGKRRIYARPGAITSKLRRAWGLEGAKKENGERVDDDRHHAVDALVLAATTESLLLRVTKDIQQRKDQGRSDDILHVQQPWQDFRRDVTQVVYGENGVGGVFVSRAERRRARGKAHDATIKQIRQVNGVKILNEPPTTEKLTEKDLKRIPMPEPYGKMANP